METHEVDRVIEMAWEDRTPFDAIAFQFGLSEKEVIVLMRTHLKPSSWRRWRKRVQGRGLTLLMEILPQMIKMRSKT